MEADQKLKLLILCLLMTIAIPALKANIGEHDEVWKLREEEAHQSAKEAYKHDPVNVTDHLNLEVHE